MITSSGSERAAMADPVKEAKVGPANAVPCPWCSKTNDFEGAVALKQTAAGELYDCDHCGKTCQIVEIKEITLIKTRQWAKPLPPTPAPEKK
jgi:transcription elongation factor Elf1